MSESPQEIHRGTAGAGWPRSSFPRAYRLTNILAWSTILAIWPVTAALAQKSQPPAPGDLASTSIEDLLDLKVTSASKSEQKLSQTPSAIFVITQEDIRTSGATNIPDLLRMVPGVDVAQINANTWAITARGFNARFGNDVLVMLDGRAVYTESFGGVYWDVLDLPLEDIERIEVTRGPGGAVWGANTDNGFINIITKKAQQTPGGMVEAGGGNLGRRFATVQYGGAIGAAASYRMFAKYFNQGDLPGLAGQSNGDTWQQGRVGFRMDATLSKKDTLTTEGDLYAGPEDETEPLLSSIAAPAPQFFDGRVNLTGGFLQSTWNHVYANGSDSTLMASYDHYDRPDVLGDRRSTLNLDFHHHFLWGNRQDIVWGVDYRYSEEATTGSLFVSFTPADLNTQPFGAFVQDQIAFANGRLHLTLGTKVEHNYYSGWGEMPTVRASWNLSTHQMAWAAVSRALRTPSRHDADLRLNYGGFTPPGGTPVAFSQLGNPNIEDEAVLAYEAGYRASFSDRLSVDLAVYYNRYTHQNTDEPLAPFLETSPAPPHILEATEFANLMNGETHGFELFGDWKISARWTIKPGYAFEHIAMHLAPTSRDTTSVSEAEGSTPASSAQLRSHVTLSSRLAWDASAYFVSRLGDPAVPSYTRFDTGLTWSPFERVSFSLVGQNLLKDAHLEFIDLLQSTTSSLMKRSGYAKAVWTF